MKTKTDVLATIAEKYGESPNYIIALLGPFFAKIEGLELTQEQWGQISSALHAHLQTRFIQRGLSKTMRSSGISDELMEAFFSPDGLDPESSGRLLVDQMCHNICKKHSSSFTSSVS